jgi:hypothetical protein
LQDRAESSFDSTALEDLTDPSLTSNTANSAPWRDILLPETDVCNGLAFFFRSTLTGRAVSAFTPEMHLELATQPCHAYLVLWTRLTKPRRLLLRLPARGFLAPLDPR